MTGRIAGTHNRVLVGLVAILLAAALFTFFFPRILANHAISEDNCVLGADVGSYNRGIQTLTFMALKSRKHPLAVMSVAAIALPLAKLGLDPKVAGSIALALLQACGGLALFLFLSRNFFSVMTSALTTLLVYSFFSTVTLLSVTE